LPHGTLLIDAPPCPEDARSWRAALRNLGSGVNRVLVNLDDHFDRTLGVRTLECAVLAHVKTAEIIRERSAVFKGQGQETGAEWEACIGLSGIRWAPPDLTYSEQVHLHWNEDKPIILEHHPGPKPGATWFHIPHAKIVFVGDHLLIDQPPFLTNADLDPWIEGVELLLTSAYRDYLVISGRGGPTPVDTIKSTRTTLKYIRRRLETLAGRDDPPEATDALIPKLLSDLDFPKNREELYTQRLRFGLRSYYTQHYHPVEVPEEE
jgi:glyoxylase-like metal-dependent hydrolase (beta-lactamase superfamily II)